jgi:large subunit ribosomal protein L11
MEFCKAFNAATQNVEPGTPIPVVITVYGDRSFTFITKKPPVSFFLKKAANVAKGANNPGKEIKAKVSMAQIREIAEGKMEDLNAHTIDAAAQMIRGSALSMGFEVTE